MSEQLLEIQNVTKIFNGGIKSRDQVVAVENVSLSLPASPAKTITLAGESGSGKTTLGLLVLGFHKANQGKILYKGTDLTRLNRQEKDGLPARNTGGLSKPLRSLQSILQNRPYL